MTTNTTRADRDRRIVAGIDAGRSGPEVADAEGISERTVWRVVAAARAAAGNVEGASAPRIEPVDLDHLDVLEVFAETVGVLGWATAEARRSALTARTEAGRIAAVRTAAAVALDRNALVYDRTADLKSTAMAGAFLRQYVQAARQVAKDAGIDPAAITAELEQVRAKALESATLVEVRS
jgi:hypothetical protein